MCVVVALFINSLYFDNFLIKQDFFYLAILLPNKMY